MPEQNEAFYEADRDAFVATQWTRGPWDERAQHAGPPAALLGRAIERVEPHEWRVARITVELLKPIPIARFTVEARAVRTAKRVQLVEAVLRHEEQEIAIARAWRMRVEPGVVDATVPEPPSAPGPEGFEPGGAYAPEGPSYFSAMEWRFARGQFLKPGPSAAWMRMRVSLVAGEQVEPLSRVLTAADSGNGISTELDLFTNIFINTELTVHLFRMPVGEWVLLDAQTRIDGDGIGLTNTVLSDEQVRIGSAAQSLLCARR